MRAQAPRQSASSSQKESAQSTNRRSSGPRTGRSPRPYAWRFAPKCRLTIQTGRPRAYRFRFTPCRSHRIGWGVPTRSVVSATGCSSRPATQLPGLRFNEVRLVAQADMADIDNILGPLFSIMEGSEPGGDRSTWRRRLTASLTVRDAGGVPKEAWPLLDELWSRESAESCFQCRQPAPDRRSQELATLKSLQARAYLRCIGGCR
jgi:hypothetical protein